MFQWQIGLFVSVYLFLFCCHISGNGSVGAAKVILILLNEPVIYPFSCVSLFTSGPLIRHKPAVNISLEWFKFWVSSFLFHFWQLFVPVFFVKISSYCFTIMTGFSGYLADIFPFLKIHFS